MAGTGFETSVDPDIPPAKHQIERIVNETYSRGLAIIPTGHAQERLDEREVTLQEIRQVLTRRRSRAEHKDEYHRFDDAGNEIRRWSYAFIGLTTDERRLRVCVSVVENPDRKVLIVTVCDED